MNERVYIHPIRENGTIIKRRFDDSGEPLIDVKRDSDGEIQLCREHEIGEERYIPKVLIVAMAEDGFVSFVMVAKVEKDGDIMNMISDRQVTDIKSDYIKGNPYVVYGKYVKNFIGQPSMECEITVAEVTEGDLRNW